jgi:Tol biopolymer transport system component
MPLRLWIRMGVVLVVAVGSWTLAGGVAGATAPGQNGPIAFELYSPANGFVPQVARMTPDGSHRRILTAPAPGEPRQPDWSADGRWIAYVTCTGEESSCNIWVIGRNGHSAHQVTRCPARWCFGNLSPTWTPDGRWIVFERDQRNAAGENRPGLFAIHPNGEGMHRLTRAPIDRDTSHTDAQLSPDGRWIVFTQVVHESDDPNHLYVIRFNGRSTEGRAHRLTPRWLDSDTPDWSPDGRLIVFTGHPRVPGVDGTANIYSIRPNGLGLRRLTHSAAGKGFDFFPCWSPNGRRIVFNHVDDAVDDLFTINRWGRDVRRVTHTANVFEVGPDWGSRLR